MAEINYSVLKDKLSRSLLVVVVVVVVLRGGWRSKALIQNRMRPDSKHNE